MKIVIAGMEKASIRYICNKVKRKDKREREGMKDVGESLRERVNASHECRVGVSMATTIPQKLSPPTPFTQPSASTFIILLPRHHFCIPVHS